MKDIIIIGAGGLGREILGLIRSVNKREPRWRIEGLYDDGAECGRLIHGLPILDKVGDLNAQQGPLSVAIAIDDPSIKRKVYDGLNRQHLSLPVLISPDVAILDERSVSIGEDALCCARTILTYDITVGTFTLPSLCYMVGYDVVVEPFCSFMPSVNIFGETHIRAEVYMDTSSSIINHISIGRNITIGAGAIVTKDILVDCVVVGCLVRPIKFKLWTAYSIS